MNDRSRRLHIVREVMQTHQVRNQAELIRLLARSGVRATQATLSRDLRTLGVLKGPEGYTFSAVAPGGSPEIDTSVLIAAVRSFLRWAKQAGNMVVLKTGPGQASALALELDNALPAQAVGTLAGDDTVFLAMTSSGAAAKVARQMNRLLSGPTVGHDGS